MLDEILRNLMSEQPSKFGITLGRGVLGKTAPVIGVGILAMGGIALTIDNIWVQLAFGAGICAVVLYYIREAFKYAHAFPHHALLENANLIKALQIEQSAKDQKIIEGEVVPTANTSPPKSITSGGG